ncbi:MAG: hypothetical protein JXX28_07770 [Deltaproteobacteria bacterium]|nr:hypothetical protein [Deltaproteobacteria bacterium]
MIALLLLAGCVVGGADEPRPRDLASSWEVDRLRVLAIRAEPPEAAPGTEVALEALVAGPPGLALPSDRVWLACAEATPLGCPLDPELLTGEPTPDELVAAGLIGLEPRWAPTYTPSAELLSDADPRARENGVYVTAEVILLPEGGLEAGALDFNAVEVATKRIVVSETGAPNHNPPIRGWTVDGWPLPSGATALVTAGEAYELGIDVPEDAPEAYQSMDTDGLLRDYTEALYATWYATSGELLESWTLHPWHQATWIAPAVEGQEGVWWAVLRDRRGGLTWIEQPFRVVSSNRTG